MVMYDNEFKTKGNKIWTKDKIEPQHIQYSSYADFHYWNSHIYVAECLFKNQFWSLFRTGGLLTWGLKCYVQINMKAKLMF